MSAFFGGRSDGLPCGGLTSSWVHADFLLEVQNTYRIIQSTFTARRGGTNRSSDTRAFLQQHGQGGNGNVVRQALAGIVHSCSTIS